MIVIRINCDYTCVMFNQFISGAGEGIQGGVNKVMDLFFAQGGLALGSALEAFTGTKAGQEAVAAVLSFLSSLGK